jgi:hypothetical protein
MNPTQETAPQRSHSVRPRWSLMALVLVVVLLAGVFIASRAGGQTDRRRWEQYRKELEQRDEPLGWRIFAPTVVADADNFLAAPGMMAWFSKQKSASNAAPIFQVPGNPLSLAQLKTLPESAESSVSGSASWPGSRQNVRDWFAGVEVKRQLLVQASMRPFTWFNTDAKDPVDQDIPNFVNLRRVAQALASHANLNWVDQQLDVALQDLQLLQRLADVPASTPTLVGGMIRVAIWGLYVQTVLDGLQAGALRDSDLAAVQQQIKDVNLLDALARSLRAERAGEIELLTHSPRRLAKLLATSPSPGTRGFRYTLAAWQDWLQDTRLRFRLRSSSWIYRNQAVIARSYQETLDQIDQSHARIHARALSQNFNRTVQTLTTSSDTRLAAMLIPNCARAALRTAQTQTALNQLQVACGLERYRRRQGAYPERLDALVPDWLPAIPDDLFTAGQLRYRRTSPDAYVLWSIGWDEQDDDARPGPPGPDGRPQFPEQNADWVLQGRPH